MSKIYTKKGDKGFTTILSGEKLSKSSYLMYLLGGLDELNSALGVVISYSEDCDVVVASELMSVQRIIFEISSEVAKKKISNNDYERRIAYIEERIDFFTEKLPPLNNFIFPGGSKASAHTHLARSICRRVERDFWGYIEGELIPVEFSDRVVFINRLSDFLFTLARYVNDEREITWVGKD